MTKVNTPTEKEGSNTGKEESLWRNALEYVTLLKRNPRYRLYLLSHICQHIGDWYLRIASIVVLERLVPESATAVSVLVVVKTVPQIFFTHIGGVLADSIDRKKLMLTLDVLGGPVAVALVMAIRAKSLSMFYLITALRAISDAIYEPSTRSLVPMIVPDKQELKQAITLNGIAWATMLAVGGIIAGKTEEYIGLEACYYIDGITAIISAIILSFIPGDYRISTTKTVEPSVKENATPRISMRKVLQPMISFFKMLYDVFVYLCTCGFGALVLLKSSGAAAWGASDVMNAMFADVPGDENATSDRLGIIYSCVGIGCFAGPLAANLLTSSERPSTLQLVCFGGFIFIMSGWLGLSQSYTLVGVCIFSGIRALGASVIYMNSTYLLQHITAPEVLGRVMAVEFTMEVLAESGVAFITGRILDTGVTKQIVSFWISMISVVFLIIWGTYHMFGKGAAQPRFNRSKELQLERKSNTTFL